MCIFKKTSKIKSLNRILLVINQIKFFDMSKNKKLNPILKRNGVKTNYITHNHLVTILA